MYSWIRQNIQICTAAQGSMEKLVQDCVWKNTSKKKNTCKENAFMIPQQKMISILIQPPQLGQNVFDLK